MWDVEMKRIVEDNSKCIREIDGAINWSKPSKRASSVRWALI